MSSESKKKSKPEAPGPSIAGREFAQDIFNLAFLVVLAIVFFIEVIVRGQIFFAGDIMNVYSPWQAYNQEALASGRVPLWCNDFFTGFPLFAESQGALFYPPTRIIYALVTSVRAFSYDVILHFIMAGWFQYFFARTLKLGPTASLLAAVAFAFSGMFLSLPINFTIFRSVVWIPLIFMFLTMGARRGSLFFPLLTALALVMQMMAGSVPITGITGLALIPYVIFLILSPGKDKQPNLIPLLQLILSVLLAAGLYMFQLLPTWELNLHAWRGTQGDYSVASAFSFPPEHFIDMILPTFYGSYADGTLLPVRSAANFFPYIGLAPLLLVIPSLGSKKRGLPILFVLVVLFLALAVGKYGVIYDAVYSTVPFFDKFRAPDRFWFIAVFAGTLMAGYGLERLVQDVESKDQKITANFSAIIGFVLFLVTLFLAGTIYAPAVRTIWDSLVDSTFDLTGLRGGIDPLVYGRWRGHFALIALHAVVAVTAFHFAIAMFGRKGRSGMMAGMIVLITIVDLYAISLQVPAVRTTNKDFFTEPPRSASVLMRDGEPNRFYSFLKTHYAREVFDFQGNDDTLWYNGGGSHNVDDFYELREALSPNIFMHWDLTASNGFASLFLERYFDLELATNQQLVRYLEQADNGDFSISEWDDQALLVDLMAARYVLTPIPFEDSGRFSLVDDGPMNVYRNRRALPRAWVARPEAVLAENQNTWNQLLNGEFDPRTTLILHPVPNEVRRFPDGAEGDATARIRHIGGAEGAGRRGGEIIDEQVLIEVSSPQPAYLILADTHYPGWVAEIDGVPVDQIYRAFTYFRAIEIPAGERIVRFYYRPQSYAIGLALSGVILGTFILLAIVQMLFFSRQKPKKPEE